MLEIFLFVLQTGVWAVSAFPSDISTTMVPTPTFEGQLDTQKITNVEGILGVRWMLGNSFALQQQYKNNERYILMFNSHSKLQGDVTLYLQKSPISCSYRQVFINNQTSYIYRCNVNYYVTKNEVKYKIVSQKTFYSGDEENMTVKYKSQILYEGYFRAIVNRIQPVFLGHMDVGDKKGLGTLWNQLNTNKNINLILFSGSFNSKLSQVNYQLFLLTVSMVSSTVPVVLLNLNWGENELFQQLFYTPQTQIYQSYFWLLSLPSSLIVMAINPIIIQKNVTNEYNYIGNILKGQISAITRDLSVQEHFLLLIAPTFDNILIQTQNNNDLQDIGFKRLLADSRVTLYMSYQSNGYFRSELDTENVEANHSVGNYSFDFPVHVNEGSEGQDDKQVSKYDFYSPLTGFGILWFQTSMNKEPTILSYQHFSYDSGQIEDSFTLKSSLNKENNIELFIAKIRDFTIAIEFMFLMVLLGMIGYAYFKLRPRRSTSATDHIEMVQESQNNPPNQLRQPIIL